MQKPKRALVKLKKPTPLQVQAASAHELYMRLKELKLETGMKFLETGAILHEIKEHQYYTGLGHETFESFTADPELDLSRGYVSTAINIHRKFILEFKVDPALLARVGWSKVARILPIATIENWRELLQQAEGNSKSDLAKALKQRKGGIDDEEGHEHNWKYTRECEDCGQVRTMTKPQIVELAKQIEDGKE